GSATRTSSGRRSASRSRSATAAWKHRDPARRRSGGPVRPPGPHACSRPGGRSRMNASRGPSVAEADHRGTDHYDRPETALAISVVMPAFNEEEILESSVRAVVDGMRTRDRRFEVIVVENGSTDDTAAIADALA